MAKKGAVLGLFALLVIIIGIALAVYFSTKKSDDEETSDKPELTFDANAKKTINPQEAEDNGTQEGYAIEYAEGDDSGKFIDLTLSWTNGQGFDSVNKLIFTRTAADGTTKIQADQEVTEESALSDYGTGSVTFKGSDVTASSVKGKNTIKAYWNEVKPDNLLATAELDITEDDFNYTLTGPFGDLDVKVTIIDETFKLTKSVKKTYYQISHAPGRWFNVNQNSNGTIKFKFDDGTFLKFGGKDTFKLAKYKNKKMLTNIDGGETFVWVHNKQAWKPVGNLDKDDFRFAQCDLLGATTIMSSDELLTPNDSKLWKSPNGEWRAVYQNDGNFVVYKENDSANTVSAYTSSNGSTKLTLSANGNIAFKKADDTLVKSSGGHKFSTKQGLKPPFRFIVSDFGGLHVISKEGTEVMSHSNQFFGPYSNYYKTHTGDLWGYDIATHHGSTFGECAEECDKNIKCAGFTHNHKAQQCWTKSYDSRILGVASNRDDQNADRWINTKENGGTEWIDGYQYYQKKIDSLCYRDRYPDLQTAFGDNSLALRNHYFSSGISEGRNASCDTTRLENSKLGYINPADGTTGFKNYSTVTKMSAKECSDYVKSEGHEVWGYRTPAHDHNPYHNTCYSYSTGNLAKKGSLTGDSQHFTGCVNGKTLESGCTQ